MRRYAISVAALLAASVAVGCSKHRTAPFESAPTPQFNHASLQEKVPYEEMIPPVPAEESDSEEDILDESGFPEEFRGPDLYQLIEQEAARPSDDDTVG